MHARGSFRFAVVCLFLVILVVSGGARHPIPAVAQVEAVASSIFDDFSEQPPLVLRPSETTSLSPICRLGVSAWEEQLTDYDLIANFGVGLYYDFRYWSGNVAEMQGAEYLPMIRLAQTRPDDPDDPNAPVPCGPDYGYRTSPALTPTALGAVVLANPGRTWIVGNEPDRRNVQDDICPQQYAEAYHDVYHFIKSYDPLAKVAFAGLVQVTPGRLQYLDIVWNTYRQKYGVTMPVDVWTFHVYIFSESNDGDSHIALGTDPSLAIPFSFDCGDPNSVCYAEHDDVSLFTKQVVMMRNWMKNHGQQDKPLLLTEFGILLPYDYDGTCSSTTCPPGGLPGCFCDNNLETFHPERVADYLEATFDYLMTAKDTTIGNPVDDFRLVQQWAWFSVGYAPLGSASDLARPTLDGTSYALTVPGVRYQQWAEQVSTQADLFPTRVAARSDGPGDMTSPVTATLMVEVGNSGNATLTQPFSVTFYSNATLTSPIGSVTVDSVPGCGRAGPQVSVQWPNLSAGLHRYWVKVNSGDPPVPEITVANNVMQGTFIANGYRNYLPTAMRSF